jgi:hypothetical protein
MSYEKRVDYYIKKIKEVFIYTAPELRDEKLRDLLADIWNEAQQSYIDQVGKS